MICIMRAHGTYPRSVWKGALVQNLPHIHLLVFDDPGLVPLADMDRMKLLEVIEDRHGSGSTIGTGQLPIGHWHETIGECQWE